MDQSTRLAWILLSIPAPGATTRDIHMRALFLNNTEATDAEVQESLGVLREHGLITITEGTFGPTALAQRIFRDEWDDSSMYETWKRIAGRLETLIQPREGPISS